MPKIYLIILSIFLSASLSAQPPSGYYSSAEGVSGDALKTALYQIIKGHTEYPYTSSSPDVWDILKDSDKDPDNPDNVLLFYTGWSVNAAQEYNNGSGWNREHVWAKSRGDFGTSLGAGTDTHHLRPCDISVNSARNNRWFDHADQPYLDNGVETGCYTSSTSWVWQPRDQVKGDVARMIFYMATRYEGENGEPDLVVIDSIPADNYTNDPVHAKLSSLLEWHQDDPVDDNHRGSSNDELLEFDF
jgi:endonuclease I